MSRVGVVITIILGSPRMGRPLYLGQCSLGRNLMVSSYRKGSQGCRGNLVHLGLEQSGRQMWVPLDVGPGTSVRVVSQTGYGWERSPPDPRSLHQFTPGGP